MAPVIFALRSDLPEHDVEICSTGQHREMLRDVFAFFSLRPDVDLRVMRRRQGLSALSSSLMRKFSKYLRRSRPDLVIVHGDTSSSFAAAVCSFYAGIPVVHVEAGLRTGDKQQPFPEEFNRRAIAAVAEIHFAPTELAHNNLIREGAKPERAHVVGNTIVDAVGVVNRVLASESPSHLEEKTALYAGHFFSPWTDDYVLVTVHRRENFGKPLERVIRALKKIAADFPGLKLVVMVHPNPMVARPLRRELAGVRNVILMKPLSYLDFARLIKFSKLVITDSGGVQEECVSFGKPLLVLREKSERPEGVTLGLAELVGTDDETIISRASDLLTRDSHTLSAQNPYGDGLASIRIAKIIGDYLEER